MLAVPGAPDHHAKLVEVGFGGFMVGRIGNLESLTQFGRVLNELNIELFCANSSQAKGRVERANETLQDRLVKEMRLQGIDTIEQASARLPDFIADFNRRFARPVRNPKICELTTQSHPLEGLYNALD